MHKSRQESDIPGFLFAESELRLYTCITENIIRANRANYKKYLMLCLYFGELFKSCTFHENNKDILSIFAVCMVLCMQL